MTMDTTPQTNITNLKAASDIQQEEDIYIEQLSKSPYKKDPQQGSIVFFIHPQVK